MRIAGAAVALLVFLTWAAAAYAAVGTDPVEPSALAGSAAELGTDLGTAARLAALLLAGFLPAVFLIAREGKSRPTLAELPDD